MNPYLIVKGADRLLDFLKEAFCAEETFRMAQPDGTIGHAEARIGDSMVMMGEAGGQWSPMTASLHLYVEDCDAVYRRAVQAGATSLREPADQFYGDRSAGVRDPFGNAWWIAPHVEDIPPEELKRRAAAQAQGQG